MTARRGGAKPPLTDAMSSRRHVPSVATYAGSSRYAGGRSAADEMEEMKRRKNKEEREYVSKENLRDVERKGRKKGNGRMET